MDHIEWTGEDLRILDQRRLPGQVRYLNLKSIDDCFRSISQMQVRGAPLIGVVGAFGLALFTRDIEAQSKEEFFEKVSRASEYISNARPTAYNLKYCVQLIYEAMRSKEDIDSMKSEAIRKAIEIMKAEEESSRRIGENGEPLLEDGDTVLTHCNAGELATIRYGTALAPIRVAAEKGKCLYVIATETRPAQQGARLTAWELARDRIPVTVDADTAVGYLMEKGMVDKVLVGADRITADGYVFNKIGTYQIAVLAKEHKIPFYVAAPASTFDLHTAHDAVTVEEREATEVAVVGGKRIVPRGVRIYNPVFDRTPPTFVKSIISEKGIIYPPFDKNISRVVVDRT